MALLPACGLGRFFSSQPVHLNGEGYVFLYWGWDETECFIHVQNIQLDAASADGDPVRFIDVTPWPAPSPWTLIYPGLDGVSANERVEQLFIDSLRDLDQKVIAQTGYALVRAAAILRQLLLDSQPLVHLVNRKYGHKLIFEVRPYQTPPSLPVMFHRRDMNPEIFPGAKTNAVALDEFLALPVLHCGNVTSTAKDLIKACANAKGGVHWGNAGSPREQRILDVDQQLAPGPLDASLIGIANIGRVVLRGLRPVVSVLNSSP